MRRETVLSPYVLIAVGILTLAACSNSAPPDGPGAVKPISELKDSMAIRIEATGAGNCNFDASPDDLNVAALDITEYAKSAQCGACAEVQGPKGKKIVVRIVDSCPGCTAGELALSKEAFDAMDASDYLKANISWQYVTCPVTGPVRYRFKEDSNPYWVAIQVRNHRVPIQKFEWEKDGTWFEVPREDYNYFVQPGGMGPGPVHVRITASNGKQLEDTLPQVIQATVVDGAAQFDLD